MPKLQCGNYHNFYFLDVTVDASCANTYDSDSLTVSTPNYPSSYAKHEYCTWKISAPPGRRLKLNSFSYRMESESTCSYDSLNIYDGPSSSSSRIARLCGRGRKSPIESTGNELFLKFKSDESSHHKGFKIYYSYKGTRLHRFVSVIYYNQLYYV